MNSLYAIFLSYTRDKVSGASKLLASWRGLLLLALLLLSAACSDKATIPSAPYSTQTSSSVETMPKTTLAASTKNAQLVDPEFPEQKQSGNRPDKDLLRTTQTVTPPAAPPSGTPLPHPEKTSDLLFIAGGDLMRWDYVTGFSGSLVGDVAEFAASANGKKVAVLRPKKIAANGVELFDLGLLDFETMQVTNLLEETARLYHMSISPDGSYIAYMTDQQTGVIYALRTDEPAMSLELGLCHFDNGTTCQDLTWSPDGKQIIWSDAQGVWDTAPGRAAPHLVHSGKLEVSDPQGKKSIIDVQLQGLKWSPVGRYVLTTVTPTASGVNWHAVLDTLTGRLIEVPDSFENVAARENASWSPDGDLIAAQTVNSTEPGPLAIKIWHVLATHDGLLIPGQAIVLSSENFSFTYQQIDANGTPCLNWLAAIEVNALMLGATVAKTNTTPVLFQLDLADGKLDELIEIPFQASDVLWSPDGAGALIIDTAGQVFFAHSSSGNLYNLSLVLGKDANYFTWLPPAPRS